MVRREEIKQRAEQILGEERRLSKEYLDELVHLLYLAVVCRKSVARPKRRFPLRFFCPKCHSRLKRRKIKELLTEVRDKIPGPFSSGLPYLCINHYTCNCGYEYAEKWNEGFGAM